MGWPWIRRAYLHYDDQLLEISICDVILVGVRVPFRETPFVDVQFFHLSVQHEVQLFPIIVRRVARLRIVRFDAGIILKMNGINLKLRCQKIRNVFCTFLPLSLLCFLTSIHDSSVLLFVFLDSSLGRELSIKWRHVYYRAASRLWYYKGSLVYSNGGSWNVP